MGRKRYELGVSLYRRQSFWSLPSGWQLGTVSVLIGILGLGYTGVIPGFSGMYTLMHHGQAEDARRQNRLRSGAEAGRYASSDTHTAGRSYWLRVRPAVTGVPTAAPSANLSVPGSDSTVIDLSGSMGNPGNAATVADTASQTGTPAPDQTALPTPILADMPAKTDVQQSAAIPSAPNLTVSVAAALPAPIISVPTNATGLDDPAKKEIAMELVSSAENSSLDWKAQYGYIEDIGDGRGYTAGIIGFCSGTGDMLDLIQHYTQLKPGNVLAKYIPALQKLDNSDSHDGLDPSFVDDWKTAAKDTVFQQAQNDERDRVYFSPAVSQAKSDGLRTLGQFIYYDAMVMHGPGDDADSFGGIRAAAMKKARTPAQGGDETAYLNAFLDARVAAMKKEAAHDDVDRVEKAQRPFLKAGNLDLNTPLSWTMYGDPYSIR